MWQEKNSRQDFLDNPAVSRKLASISQAMARYRGSIL
jgi:hypothetical protein